MLLSMTSDWAGTGRTHTDGIIPRPALQHPGEWLLHGQALLSKIICKIIVLVGKVLSTKANKIIYCLPLKVEQGNPLAFHAKEYGKQVLLMSFVWSASITAYLSKVLMLQMSHPWQWLDVFSLFIKNGVTFISYPSSLHLFESFATLICQRWKFHFCATFSISQIINKGVKHEGENRKKWDMFQEFLVTWDYI